jgi:Histone H1-like nucleoprotein HC2
MSGASLSIPGLLHVGTSGAELATLHVGPAVGWVALKGIHSWSREISVARKADVSEATCRELKVVLPESHPAVATLPHARLAAQASTLVAVDSSLVDKLVAKGVRVYTIGSDSITGGFYCFANGGAGGAVRVQGNLVEMVAAGLNASADNAAIEAVLDGVIDRVLAELSKGVLSEAQIELAAALPTLGEPTSEAAAKLQTLEGFLALAASRAAKYEQRGRSVVAALEAAGNGERSIQVPLFGEARRVTQPELEIEYAEGESGSRHRMKLPARSRWLVAGLVSETMPPPAVATKTEDDKAAADKAAAEKAAAAKAAAEKAAAEKAAAEKVAAEKAAAEKAAAEKAAAEKAAAEKAAAEKAAAEKAAAEKAAAEKAAAEKAAAEKAAAEKAATEKAAAEKAAAEKTAAKKAAADKPAAGKKASAEKASAPTAAARSKKAEEVVPAGTDSAPMPAWVWLVVLLVAVGGVYYFVFAQHH